MNNYYAKGTYSIDFLKTLNKETWSQLDTKVKADIRLALSQSIPYAKGQEKETLFQIRSKLIDFSMNS